MSFWRSQGWFNSSPINKLLDNETIPLTEIFEQDDIISELKTNNKKLIDYLKGQRNIEQMIEYLTLETDAETEENRKYKYPWISAEILSADTAVVDALLENEESYLRLLNFLFSPQLKQTSPFLTTYVCKVFGFLLAKNSNKVIDSLKAKETEISNFFDNIDNSSVLELLLKVIASDISEHSYGVSEWLLKVKLIETFIEKLTPQNNYNTHENISQFVSSVISLSLQVPYSPLLDYLRDEKIISRVFEVIRNSGETTDKTNLEEYLSSIKFGIAVVNDIVKLFLTNSVYDNNTSLDRIPSSLSVCLKQIDLFSSLLQTSTQKSAEIETTFGKIVPLGSHRLQLVELLQSLCASRYTSIYAFFIENNLFTTLYNLFFEYPWNNLLHIMVSQMTQNVLDSGNETLIHSLLVSTKIHVLLAEVGNASIDKESKRLGLMGIVSKLATSIQNINYPSVIELLEESEEWEEYLNGDFLETKKKENTPIGKASPSEEEPSDDQGGEEMKLFQSRTKRNFEITFPDDFAVGDFDDKDLEVYFLAKDEKHFQGINTDEEGLDVFAEFV